MRRSDWRARLNAYIVSHRATPFGYGTHDCALFAAGAVEAMTGEDMAAAFRGAYDSAEGGLVAMQAAGFESPIALAASRFERIPASLAAVGDIAVVDTENGPAIGVVQGAQIAMVGPSGLMLVPLTSARLAFRV